MIKKIIKASLTASMVFASATAFAAGLSNSEIVSRAKEYVPAAAEVYDIENDRDDNSSEVKFFDVSDKKLYKVEISNVDGRILEFELKERPENGSLSINKTVEDVKKAVLEEYPEAEIVKVELDRDDGYYHYEVDFITAEYRGEVKLDAETAKIFAREYKYFLRK